MMGCSPTGFKTFLVCSNVALLFVGLSVFILGIKMKWAMSVLQLISIPMIGKAVDSVLATGIFISLSGVTGIGGSCYELMWLLMVHLVSLGVIVIMEFSVGVTLMIVKKTVESELESADCNSICAAAVDAMILDYALPSAGLMMTIIFVEALMIYSAIRLFFYIRDGCKASTPVRPSTVAQNVQMQRIEAPLPTYVAASRSTYTPQITSSQMQPGYASPQFILGESEEQQENVEAKPPDYYSLPQQPPLYTTSTALEPTATNTIPKVTDGSYHPV